MCTRVYHVLICMVFLIVHLMVRLEQRLLMHRSPVVGLPGNAQLQSGSWGGPAGRTQLHLVPLAWVDPPTVWLQLRVLSCESLCHPRSDAHPLGMSPRSDLCQTLQVRVNREPVHAPDSRRRGPTAAQGCCACGGMEQLAMPLKLPTHALGVRRSRALPGPWGSYGSLRVRHKGESWLLEVLGRAALARP